MDTNRICPSCQKPLPPDVPLGLCPSASSRPASTPAPSRGLTKASSSLRRSSKSPAFSSTRNHRFIGKGAWVRSTRRASRHWTGRRAENPATARGQRPGFAERFNAKPGRWPGSITPTSSPSTTSDSREDCTIWSWSSWTAPIFAKWNTPVDWCPNRRWPSSRKSARPSSSRTTRHCSSRHQPENILLDKRGRVKITDFGIAKIIGASTGKFRSPAPRTWWARRITWPRTD